MLRASAQRLAIVAIAAALLGAPVPALAAPPAATAPANILQVQAPAQITAAQPFAVQITLAVPAGSQPTATLSLIDDNGSGLALGGTLQAQIVNGTATFPAVVVTGAVTTPHPVHLVAVALEGQTTVSGASGAVLLQPAPAPTYHDSTPGGIGIDETITKDKLMINEAFTDKAAYQAGVRDGDQIVAIDGKPVTDPAKDSEALGGPVGSTVVVTVKHKGSDLTQAISIVRIPIMHSSITFNAVPNQPNYGMFQISVHVADGTGQPLPDAHVTVALDPKHNKAHFLFFSTNIDLKDASGSNVPHVSGVTGPDGVATMWVRLGSNTTPFDAALQATIQWHDQLLSVTSSNVFTVFDPSN